MEAGLATEMIYEFQLDYMDNSETFLREGILRSSIMKFHCITEEWASDQNWIDLDEGKGSEFSTMEVYQVFLCC